MLHTVQENDLAMFNAPSFLQQNLAALSSCPEHDTLKDQLQQYIAEALPAPQYDLQETHVGDLTLWHKGFAIHAISGAVAEAQALVAQQVLTAQHAINCILGLGLGYTTQAIVEQYATQCLPNTAFIIVYEPDLALLHFILSNINLSHYLKHPALRLLSSPELLYTFVESHLVAGDGISFIATEGYLKAEATTLQPVIEKLSKHAINTLRNAELLSNRGKLWATQFLQNLSKLVTLLPINAVQDCLTGKVGVLCGAGPSLLDDVETLKQQRDNIVLFAVTGAVAPLLNVGIVPDFIVSMDYIGPSKHFKNIPKDALKTANFVMGPSAEGALFQWEHRSSWLGTLHFNEQFSYLLDTMYGEKLPRYHTGGTVSIFMLQVAFDLGIRDFVLLGQDMALRGNQVYADGTNVNFNNNMASLPETDHTVARCMELETVKGWHGEELVTQSDYAHFLYHYTRIPHLVAKEGHTVQLFNASVGGAYIEGWVHAPLAQVLNHELQALLTPVVLTKTLTTIEKRTRKQLPLTLVRSRLFHALHQEEQAVRELLKIGQKSIKYLEKLQTLPLKRWQATSKAYSDSFNQFSIQLEEHPFLRDTFYGEQLSIYQSYNKQATTEAHHRANIQIDLTYLTSLVTQLEANVLNVLVEIQQALLAQGTIEPMAIESSSVVDRIGQHSAKVLPNI
jgi:hypothetical protein